MEELLLSTIWIYAENPSKMKKLWIMLNYAYIYCTLFLFLIVSYQWCEKSMFCSTEVRAKFSWAIAVYCRFFPVTYNKAVFVISLEDGLCIIYANLNGLSRKYPTINMMWRWWVYSFDGYTNLLSKKKSKRKSIGELSNEFVSNSTTIIKYDPSNVPTRHFVLKQGPR